MTPKTLELLRDLAKERLECLMEEFVTGRDCWFEVNDAACALREVNAKIADQDPDEVLTKTEIRLKPDATPAPKTA